MKTFRKAASFTALLLAVITLITLAGSAFAAGPGNPGLTVSSAVSSGGSTSVFSFRESGFTAAASGGGFSARSGSGGNGTKVLASGPNGSVVLKDGAQVSGDEAENSILLHVFVNMINEAMTDPVPEGDEGLEEPALAEYPLDPHELEEYGDSPRVRLMTEDPEEENPNYLVYRESLLLIPQDAHAGVEAEFSEDRRTAVLKGISGLLSPEDLEGRTGLVLLEENAFLDQVFIFDGQPAWEDGALRLHLADAEKLKLNHLFSDGQFGLSGSTDEKEGDVYLQGENGELIPLRAVSGSPEAADSETGPAPATALPTLGTQAKAGAELPALPGARTAAGAGFPAAESNLPSQASGRLGGAPMLASANPGALLREGFPLRADAGDIIDQLLTKEVSGTNWSGTIKYNPADFGIDLSFDVNVFKLKFEVDLAITAGAKFDITSTGPTGLQKEKVDVAVIKINLKYGFFVDLRYQFEALFDSTPIHVTGDMKTTLVPYWSVINGSGIRSFTTDVIYDTVEIEPQYANRDINFYIGNNISFGIAWLEIKVDLWITEIHFGPVLRLAVEFDAGSKAAARLSKDEFSAASLDRSVARVHSCAKSGQPGCISLTSNNVANRSLRLQSNLYFKKWDIPLIEQGDRVRGSHEWHRSMTYGDTRFIEGVCPHIYYNIPVRTVNDRTANQPVADADVEAFQMDLIDPDVRELLGKARTDASGRANIFMPHQKNTRYTVRAGITLGGRIFAGCGAQPSDIRAGVNDEVVIILESAEKKRISVLQKWDIDLQDRDRPAAMQIAVLEWVPSENEWHVHEYHGSGTEEDPARISMSVATMDPSTGWGYLADFPLYVIDGASSRAIQYRVVQLDRIFEETIDLDLSGKSSADRAQIRARIEAAAVTEPYAVYDVPAYMALNNEAVQDHQTKYQISTSLENIDHSGRPIVPDVYTLLYTEFTNTAVYDVNLYKRWVDVPEEKRPEYVYLTLLGRPVDGWMARLTEAQAVGLNSTEMPVPLPLTGNALTLQNLKENQDLEVFLPEGVADTPLSVMKVTADDHWKASFMIKKYDRGVPRVYRAAELSPEILQAMLVAKFGVVQQVTMSAPGDGLYVSIPGSAMPVFHDWELTGTVINAGADQKDRTHIIGGVKYWVLPENGSAPLPDSVNVIVEETEVPAGRSPKHWTIPVTDPKDGDPDHAKAWVWILKDDAVNAERPEIYRISEQFHDAAQGSANLYEKSISGFDLINKWVGETAAVRIRIVWDSDVGLPEDALWPKETVRFRSDSGSVPAALQGNFTLTRHDGGYMTLISPIHVVSVDEIRNLRLQIVSCDPFFDHNTMILDPVLTDTALTQSGGTIPEYTFTIIHRIQYDLRITAQKHFDTSSWAREYGWPKRVVLGLNRDHVRLESHEIDCSRGTSQFYPDYFTTAVPRLSPDGREYLYEVVEETPGYRMLPDPDEPRDTGFICEIRLLEQSLNFAYPKSASDRTAYEIYYKRYYDVINRWVNQGSGYATVDIHITWEGDKDVISEVRPERAMVSILRVVKGTQDYEVVRTVDVTPDAEGSWDWTTTGLPERVKISEYVEKEYEYLVMEEHIPGYATFYRTEKQGGRWVCEVNNRLTGYLPFPIIKDLEIDPVPQTLQNMDFTFRIEAAPEEEIDTVSRQFPDPLYGTVTIRGEGTKPAQFLFDENGVYLYKITELENPAGTAALIYDTVPRYLAVSVFTLSSGEKEIHTYLVTSDAAADGFSGTQTGTVGGGSDSTGSEPDDLSPATADVMLADHVTFTNRVRHALTITKEWQTDTMEQDLPKEVRVIVQQQADTSGETWVPVPDSAAPGGIITLTPQNGWTVSLALDEGVYRARELNGAEILEEGERVDYAIREADGGTHITGYRVSYDDPAPAADGRQTLVIRNKAVRTVRVRKSWIGFEESEKKPVYLALLGRPEVPGEIAPDMNLGTLVLDPENSGLTDDSLRDMLAELGVGVDTGLLPEVSGTAAIGAANEANGWTVSFEVPKYDEYGTLIRYFGVEADQALLRQMLRRVYGVDLPVEYEDGLSSVSVPGRAYSALSDWTLQSMLLQDLVKAGGTLTQDTLDQLKAAVIQPDEPTEIDLLAPVLNVKVSPQDPNQISGTVIWVGDQASDRPESIDVHIYADRDEINGSPVTVVPTSADPNRPDIWIWHFDLGDDVAPGAELTVGQEFPPYYDDWDRYITSSDGLDIVNTRRTDNLEDVIFRIEKQWEIPHDLEGGGDPADAGGSESSGTADPAGGEGSGGSGAGAIPSPGWKVPVTVGFYDSSTDRKITEVTLSAENGWAAELKGEVDGQFLHGLEAGDYYILELNTPVNMRASYPTPQVKERNRIDGSETVTDRIITYTVSNWIEDQTRTSVTGRKTWMDEENKNSTRPESVLVQLYRNDEPYYGPDRLETADGSASAGESGSSDTGSGSAGGSAQPSVDKPRIVTVSAAGGWEYHFPDLPKTEAEGNPIHWSVREVKLEENGEYSPVTEFPVSGSETKKYTVTYAAPVSDSATGSTVCGITNTLADSENPAKQVTLVKKWDIDLEGKDHPDSIEAIVQKKDGDKWVTVQKVKLSASGEWKAALTLPEKDASGNPIEYRFRELTDSFLAQLEELAEEYAGQAKEKFDEWKEKLEAQAGESIQKLPAELQSALNDGFDSLKEKLDVEEDKVYKELIKELRKVTGDDRIVYASDDPDRPESQKDTPSADYYVRSYSSVLTGGTVQAHRTKYHVSYDKQISDEGTYTIKNLAVLEIDVTKRWLNLGAETERPDSAWLVLEFHPSEGALEKAGDMAKTAGVDLSSMMEFDLPCFSLLENSVLKSGLISGGTNPVTLISQLIAGIDLDIFNLADKLLTVAVKKVDEGCGWKAGFVHTKYMLGLPIEFKGAELGSEILRQIVKYILEVDLPVSYNPFQNFISVPGKAYGNLLNQFNLESMFDLGGSVLQKLTETAISEVKKMLNDEIRKIVPDGLPVGIQDWQLAANVINIKIGIDWEKDPGKIRGTKVWRNDQESDRPDSITVELLEGENVIASKVLAKEEHAGESVWDWEIDLPEGKDASGSYTVREVWPDGFSHSRYSTTVSGYDIYNTWDLVTVAGRKTWVDADNQDGLRPEKLKVYLLQDGQRVKVSVESTEGGAGNSTEGTAEQDLFVETSAASGWQWIFRDQPKTGGEGHVYTYSVEEEPILDEDQAPLYKSEVNGYHITNTLLRKDLRGKKIWDDHHNQDGKRPPSVKISVYGDGDLVKTLTVASPEGDPADSPADEWPFGIGSVPKYNPDGTEIVYTVREDAVLEDYITTQSGFEITNTHAPQQIRIIVNKVWQDADDQDGIRPDSVGVSLYAKTGADGAETRVAEGTINAADDWTYDFGERPVFQNGVRLIYRVEEEAVDGYRTEIRSAGVTSALDEEGRERLTHSFEITNIHDPERTEVTGRKIWVDENDLWKNRPDFIRVRLLRAGTPVSSQIVSSDDSWEFSFPNLPKYENHGQAVDYTVAEDVPDPYTAEITRDQDGGENAFTITNTLRRLTVTGEKVWDDADNQDGIRPDSIVLRLGATVDGQPVEGLNARDLSVPDTDQWIYAFRGLPRYTGGREITYSVIELSAPSGYDAASDPAGGAPRWNEDHTEGTVNFKNTHIPERTTVYGQKTWDDEDDRDGLRPEALTVYLMKNGKEVASRVITAENNWIYRFTDLPKYENGKIIRYTVTEEALPYAAVAYHWDLVNHYPPEKIDVQITKRWDDADNQDGIRPAEVSVALRAGGGLVNTCTLSEENGWTWTFSDLYAHEGGLPLLYRVVEAVPTGYEAEYLPISYEYDEASGKWVWTWMIINRHTPDMTEFSGRKIWDDEDDMDGLRPESLCVYLYSQFGQEDMEITSEEHDWEYHFVNLPKNRGGVPLEYYVKEEPVLGYAGETVGNDLVNTLVGLPYTVEFYYQKDGVYPETPDSIEERLARIGTEVSVTEEDLRKAEGRCSLDETAPNVFSGVIPQDGTLRLKLYFRPYYVITYDPNGGRVDGSSKPISFNHYYGDKILIHDAAVRDNYLFVCWRGSEYQPGDAYTVTQDHIFTAQWRYDNPLSYRFTFTKKWVGGTGDSLSWTLFDPDGRPVTKKFDKTAVSDTEWVYTAWFSDGREYCLVENVPEGFSVRYENTGAHAGETDRVYNGGTIVNYRIPKTGEGIPWGPVLAITGLLGLIALALTAARRRR